MEEKRIKDQHVEIQDLKFHKEMTPANLLMKEKKLYLLVGGQIVLFTDLFSDKDFPKRKKKGKK